MNSTQYQKRVKQVGLIAIIFLSAISRYDLVLAGNFNQKSDSVNTATAKIFFHRTSSMLGAAGWHYVIDLGSDLEYNSVVIQKKTFPDDQANFGKGGNVKQLYLKLGEKEFRLIAGAPQNSDLKLKSKTDVRDYKLMKNLSPIVRKYLQFYPEVYPIFFLNNESLVPNAWIAGPVDNGQTISWERPAGKMKLEVVSEGGDQIFAETIPVEAGKSYNVEYSYGKSKFTITEIK